MQTELQTKRIQLLNFVIQLSEDPDFRFCVHFQYFGFGMLDAPFIMNGCIPSLIQIKDLLKSKKKVSLKAVFNDLRKIFNGISDYVLQSDPLQISCQAGIKKINEFQHKLLQKKLYVQEDSCSETTSFRYSLKQNNQKSVSFFKQLQMAFYLINYDSNEQMIRQIGQKYSILEETDQQCILHLGNSNLWTPLITKTSESS